MLQSTSVTEESSPRRVNWTRNVHGRVFTVIHADGDRTWIEDGADSSPNRLSCVVPSSELVDIPPPMFVVGRDYVLAAEDPDKYLYEVVDIRNGHALVWIYRSSEFVTGSAVPMTARARYREAPQ